MALEPSEVARIAKLARIAVPETELAPLAAELSSILGWIEQLAEVDTYGVEPLRAVMPLVRSWRADVVTEGGDPAPLLANAPAAHAKMFVVPRVVE